MYLAHDAALPEDLAVDPIHLDNTAIDDAGVGSRDATEAQVMALLDAMELAWRQVCCIHFPSLISVDCCIFII